MGIPQGRCFSQDDLLLAEALVLPAEARQLLLLLGGQTIQAATLVEVGLAEPVADGGARDPVLPR